MRLVYLSLAAGLAAPYAAIAGMRDELPRALPDATEVVLADRCTALAPSLDFGAWRVGPAGEAAGPRGGEDRLPPPDEQPLTAEPSAARLALHFALPAARQPVAMSADSAFVTFGVTAGASFDLGLRHRDARVVPASGGDCGR